MSLTSISIPTSIPTLKVHGLENAWVILATFGVIIVYYFMKGTLKSQKSALMTAAQRGDGHAIARMLKGGADVNKANGMGMTALHFAAERGHTAVVDYLIQKGASVDAVASEIKGSETGASPLMLAATQGHAAVVRRLIEKKAKLEFKDKMGQTALMHAAFKGNAETVKALLDAGADVQVKDGRSLKAWNWAQESRDQERMALLKAATFKDR